MTQGHDVSTPRRLQFNLERYLTLQPGGGGGGTAISGLYGYVPL